MRLGLLGSVGVLLALSVATDAVAQQVPSSVEPGRIQKDVQKDITRDLVNIPELPYVEQNAMPEGAGSISFVLKDVTLEGTKALTQDDLSHLYKDMLGQTVTVEDMYGLAREITRHYRDKGYLLTQAVIPAQEIAGGSVRILVVEGFVDRYQIQGTSSAEEYGLLDDYAQKIVNSGPLTSRNLEHYLLLANDLPGIRVRAVLTPSLTTAGASDLILTVEEDAVSGFAGVDTYGNDFLGPVRLSAGVSVVPFKRMNHELTLTTLIAPQFGELQFFDATYKQALNSSGTQLDLRGSYTHSQPSLPNLLGGALGTQGEAYTLIAGFKQPILRSRVENFNVGFFYDHHKSQTFFDPLFFALDTEDRIRSIRGYAEYNIVDSWSGYNDLFFQASQGLDIFQATDSGANRSRALGESDYLKFEARAERLQRLNDKFNLLVGVNGQYSSDALLATEEFGLGGRDFGRGFDASEITGDKGLAGKLELIYSDSPFKPYMRNYQLFAFYDVGAAWNSDPGAGIAERQSLASTGVGTRFSVTDSLTGDAILAAPLTRSVQSREDHGDDVRFQFSLTKQF